MQSFIVHRLLTFRQPLLFSSERRSARCCSDKSSSGCWNVNNLRQSQIKKLYFGEFVVLFQDRSILAKRVDGCCHLANHGSAYIYIYILQVLSDGLTPESLSALGSGTPSDTTLCYCTCQMASGSSRVRDCDSRRQRTDRQTDHAMLRIN